MWSSCVGHRVWFGVFLLLIIGCGGASKSAPTAADAIKAKSASATTTTTVTTTVPVDTAAPALSSSAVLVSAVSTTGVTLTWTAATDTVTPDSDLVYLVYKSTSSLTTQADWQDASKASQVGAPTTALTTVDIQSLNPNTTYYFMVMVSDQAGNITLYDVATAATAILDLTPPVPGNSGILAFSGTTTTGFTVTWTAAADEVTSAAHLAYEVFASTTQSEVATLSAIDAANLSTQGSVPAGGTSLAVVGLAPNTTYYVNVVVSDSAGNRGVYTKAANATLQTPDTTPPFVVSASSILIISSLGSTSMTIGWNTRASTDDRTSQVALQYQLYSSLSNNIDTVAHAVANGTLVGSLLPNGNSQSVSNLAPSTTYYFNVLVQDEAGNQSAYAMTSQATSGLMYMFAEGSTHDGDLRNGPGNGRLGADAFCAAKKAASYSSLHCNYTHAFLSVTSSDYISNFPTQYGTGNGALPTSIPIANTSDVHIAANWSDLISSTVGPCSTGSLCSGGGVAGLKTVLGGSTSISGFWTGSLAGGSLASDNCTGWTGSALGQGGYYDSTSEDEENGGRTSPVPSRFLAGFAGASCTRMSADLLCLCW